MAVLGGDNSVQILIATKGDTKGIKDTEASLSKLSSQTDKSHASFLKLSAAVAAGEAAFSIAKVGVEKLGGFLKSTVDSYKENQDAAAQLGAVLTSTKMAAGLFMDDLDDMATSLQKVTTYSDEAVMGAESLLLTFTNVKGQVFKDSIPLILDMSTALGQDLKSSSIQVGKALQDPVLGITALRRVGVNFNDAQKDVIKRLVETGQTVKAQQLILKELKTEFGGSAEMAGRTFAGSLARLKNQFDDVKESIGGAIVDGITPFISKAAEFVAAIDWRKVIDKTKEAFKSFIYTFKTGFTENEGTTLEKVALGFRKVYLALKDASIAIFDAGVKVAQYLAPKLLALWHTIQEKVLPVLYRLWKEVIQPLLPIIGTLLVVAIGLVIDALNLLLRVITPVINFMLNNKPYVIAFALAFGALALAMNFDKIVDKFTQGMGTVISKVTDTKSGISNLVDYLGGPVATGGWAAFSLAAVAALVEVYKKGQETLDVLDKLNDTIAKEGDSSDAAAKRVTQSYKEGKITKDQYQQTIGQIYGTRTNNLAHYAGGTSFAQGGWSVVGERGPELVNLPRGSQVTPSSQTQQMLGQTTYNIAAVNLMTAEATREYFKIDARNSSLLSKGLSPVR